ncbi:MAG: chromosome segregation SMC family protein [Nitrososphaerota archaeon]
MVHIKRIVVQGFKSFPPRRQAIDLPRGLVVIAGPNGSGKSNILDAIKFAFGELSPHALRVSRFSELIHQSSEGGTAPMARVTVVLDNSERVIPVDDDEVVITRKLLPNGESQYLVGNRSVSRADLLSILATANVRPSGFNIVTQGAVLGIAEMGPEDLRKLIEDVAGTGEYDRRREEALKELERAERNVAVAKAAASEVRKRIKQLEAEWFDLSRRRFIEEELEALRREEIAAEIGRIDAELAALASEKSELGPRAEELRSRLSTVSAELERLEASAEAIRQRSTELESREASLSAAAEEARREMGRLQAEIRDRGRRYADARRRAIEIESSLRSADERVRSLRSRLSAIESATASLSSELEAVESQLSSVNSRIKGLESVVREWERRAASVAAERDAIQRRISDVERRLTDLRGRVSTLRARFTAHGDEISRLEARLREISEELAELDRQRAALTAEVSDAKAKIGSLMSELDAVRTTLASLRELRARVESEANAVETTLNPPGAGQVQRALLAVPGSGSLGLLRDLFEPPKGLESLALRLLGDLTEAVVVRRDVDAASIAVAASSLGLRIRVISVEGWKGCGSESGKCLACLSSTSSKEASAALHIALENAVLIDRPSFPDRMTSVTSAGAVRRRGGIFESVGEVLSESEVRRELETLRSLVPELERRAAELSSRAEALDREISDLRSLVSEREGTLRAVDSRLSSLQRERGEISGRMTRLNEERQRIEAELGRLAEEERKLLAAHEELQRQIELVVAPPEPLEEREELSRLRERQRELLVRATELRTELSRLRREREAVAAEISYAEREARTSITYLAEVERTRAGMLEAVKAVALRYAERVRELRTLASELEAVRGELNAIRSEAAEVSAKIRQHREERERVSSQLRGIEARLESLRVTEVELTVRRRALEERLMELRQGPRSLLSSLPPELTAKIRASLESELGEIQLVNQLAPMQYAEVVAGYKQRSERIAELEMERNEILKLIEEIDREKLRVLESTVKRVSEGFGEFFRALTGGDAWLEFTDPGNPLESGIEMVVRFPGKAPRSTRGVSGGEKSVSAVALILALQSLTPADFLIFDEVDAHLDANYSSNLANLLKEMSKRVQILVVSLKDIVAEKADLLIGVYSRNGASNVVTLKLGELVGEQGSQS